MLWSRRRFKWVACSSPMLPCCILRSPEQRTKSQDREEEEQGSRIVLQHVATRIQDQNQRFIPMLPSTNPYLKQELPLIQMFGKGTSLPPLPFPSDLIFNWTITKCFDIKSPRTPLCPVLVKRYGDFESDSVVRGERLNIRSSYFLCNCSKCSQ